MRQENLISRELLTKLRSVSRPQQSHAFVALGIAAAVLGGMVPIYAAFVDNSPLRLAAIPVLLALAFLLALSPRFLLFLVLFLRAGLDNLFEDSKISVFGYVTGLGGLLNGFVILIVLALVVQRPVLPVPPRLLFAWTAFFLTTTFGAVISPSKVDGVRYLLPLTTYFALFVAAFYVVQSKADWRNVVRLILWSSVIPVIYAFVDISLNMRVGLVSTFRLESTFPHANIFAFYLSLTLTLILYVLKSRTFDISPGAKIGLTAYACCMLVLLVLTQTRAAWVACAAVFAFYGVFFERRYLAYLAIACGLALLTPMVQERIVDVMHGNVYNPYTPLNSFAWRRKLWEDALLWMEPTRYLLGYGAQAFLYHTQSFFPLVDRTSAHSVYVQWFFDYGMIGLIALLWLFYTLLENARRLRTVEPLAAFVVAITTVAYVICAISDNMMDYLSFNWYVWFLVGAGYAWARTSSAEDSQCAGTRAQHQKNVYPGVLEMSQQHKRLFTQAVRT